MESATFRARSYGLALTGVPGQWNAITDVRGVEVGYVTLDQDLAEGIAVRTGVTAILPRGAAHAGSPVSAAAHTLNGNGEMTGTVWLNESGILNTPIFITNTHSVGAAHDGAVRWMIEHAPREAAQWLMPVVAETWDGPLNDINGLHVRPEHAVAALNASASGPVVEGSVGGGTGMSCYGFKGGSGTSSRIVAIGGSAFTVGVFVQANFGERSELSVLGVPVGRLLADDAEKRPGPSVPPGAGSVIVVVGTDAPLLPLQLKAMARRVPLGLARTGASGSHYSGDIFLAFSTANEGAGRDDFIDTNAPFTLDTFTALPWGRMDALFRAVVECTEEAVLNVLFASRTMTGRDGTVVPGMPNEKVARLVLENRPWSSV